MLKRKIILRDHSKLSYLDRMRTFNTQQIDEFTTKLDAYIMTRFGYKRSRGYWRPDGTINIDYPRVKLYLRWKYKNHVFENETLVIASIQFTEQKKGHGTDLLRFLREQCEYYGIEWIGIEQTNIKSGTFALKHGFIRVQEKEQFLIHTKEL